VKALSIGFVAGAALCGVISAPASAMPISNLAAAASDLVLGQSARYVCHRSRCRWQPNYVYRPQAYGPSYYSYGPSYYAPSYFGYGGGSGLYGGGLYGRWWW
jgi:hypothetical protein